MRYNFNEIKQLNANEVRLNDGFWADRYRQYSVRTVHYMFDMFDLSKSFDNFDRVAEGEKRVLGNTDNHAGQILRPDAVGIFRLKPCIKRAHSVNHTSDFCREILRVGRIFLCGDF